MIPCLVGVLQWTRCIPASIPVPGIRSRSITTLTSTHRLPMTNSTNEWNEDMLQNISVYGTADLTPHTSHLTHTLDLALQLNCADQQIVACFHRIRIATTCTL